VVVLDDFIIAFNCDETVMGFLGFHYFSVFSAILARVFNENQTIFTAFYLSDRRKMENSRKRSDYYNRVVRKKSCGWVVS
jgi:hypothetical protein